MSLLKPKKKVITRSDFVVSWDSKIHNEGWKLIGAIVFGPPKLLGLDSGIWGFGRLPGNNQGDEVSALRTALYHNLIRRKAANFVMALCLPLALVAAYFSFYSYGYYEAIQKLGPIVSGYVPQPSNPPLMFQERAKANRAFGKAVDEFQNLGDACRAFGLSIRDNRGTSRLTASYEEALLYALEKHGCTDVAGYNEAIKKK